MAGAGGRIALPSPPRRIAALQPGNPLSNDIFDMLERAIAARALPITRHPNHLSVDGDRLLLKAGAMAQPSPPGRTVVMLQLQAHAAELGRPLVESFAGAGASHDEALADAFAKLETGTLHTLLEALTSHQCAQGQATIARWGRRDAAWRVFSGPTLAQHHEGLTLGDAYPAFLAGLSRRFLEIAPPGPHWIRIFVACYHGQLQSADVLLDNDPWPEGQRLLRAQPWATTQSFQSIRQFLLAMPEPPAN
jgi:hypothetical protein